SEDGIRAFHVTGVQTCALPILTVFGEDLATEWVRSLHQGEPWNALIRSLALRDGTLCPSQGQRGDIRWQIDGRDRARARCHDSGTLRALGAPDRGRVYQKLDSFSRRFRRAADSF